MSVSFVYNFVTGSASGIYVSAHSPGNISVQSPGIISVHSPSAVSTGALLEDWWPAKSG